MHERVEEEGLYELAATLLSASAKLNKFLQKRRLEPLSFSKPAPTISLSPENAAYHEARGIVLEAAEQIVQLVRGPRDVLLELSFQVSQKKENRFHPVQQNSKELRKYEKKLDHLKKIMSQDVQICRKVQMLTIT
jgi:hypothetical protein